MNYYNIIIILFPCSNLDCACVILRQSTIIMKALKCKPSAYIFLHVHLSLFRTYVRTARLFRGRHLDSLMECRLDISGGSEDALTQFRMEVKALPSDERLALLKEAGITTSIDATQSLAIKAELALPWYRLRILRR